MLVPNQISLTDCDSGQRVIATVETLAGDRPATDVVIERVEITE